MAMNPQNKYELIQVSSEEDWQAYHVIRRKVLWENRGRNDYNDKHEDEYLLNHYPLLFKLNEAPIGTARLDDFKNGSGAVRRVAIIDELQRNGHGRELAVMIENEAKILGIKTLYVNADSGALGYYKKLGWEPYIWLPSEAIDPEKARKQMRKIIG